MLHSSKITGRSRIFVRHNKSLHYALSQAPTIITGKRLRKDVISEINNMIQQYSNMLDMLMQKLQDQVAHNVAIHIHHTGKHSDILVT
jgi:hypothetical protein